MHLSTGASDERVNPDERAKGSEYFEHVPEWQVEVCKECRHVVWPDQASSHLQNNQHRIARPEAERIVEDLQSWPRIVPDRREFDMPASVDQPIPELPLYPNGFQCQVSLPRTGIYAGTNGPLRTIRR